MRPRIARSLATVAALAMGGAAIAGCSSGSSSDSPSTSSTASESASTSASASPSELSEQEKTAEERKSNRAQLLEENYLAHFAKIDCRAAADALHSAPGSAKPWKRFAGKPIMAAAYCESLEGKEKWEIRRYLGDLDELAQLLATPDQPDTDKMCTKQYEAQPLMWVIDEAGDFYMPTWPRDECDHLQGPKPWDLFTDTTTELITIQESPSEEVPTTDR